MISNLVQNLTADRSGSERAANVRFFGDIAVVQGSETLTHKDGRKSRSVWVDTWVRRNGEWQIVAAEDVTVPIKQ